MTSPRLYLYRCEKCSTDDEMTSLASLLSATVLSSPAGHRSVTSRGSRGGGNIWMRRKLLSEKLDNCNKCGASATPIDQIDMSGFEERLYTGEKRCFGHYRCTKCGRTWRSGNSWADKGQECTRCKVMIYAHYQTPLQRSSNDNEGKPAHMQALCGKCQSLGYNCRRAFDE